MKKEGTEQRYRKRKEIIGTGMKGKEWKLKKETK